MLELLGGAETPW